MTDLEKYWDEMSTPSPPVDDLVRAARAGKAARRRRLVTRPLIATGAAAAIVGAFLVGAETGLPGSPGLPGSGDASLAAFQADLDPAQSCDELLTSYRGRALDIVDAYGWQLARPVMQAYGTSPGRLGSLEPLSTAAEPRGALSSAPRVVGQRASDTGTNVQERDVDEPDTVKTDGSRLVRVRGDDLLTYDVSGPKVVKESTLHLPRIDGAEILLVGDRVVVIGVDRSSRRDELTGLRRVTRVFTVSLDDERKPEITSDVTYASLLLSARQHGDVVRMVLAAGLPDLDFVHPGSERTTTEALEANRRVVEKSTLDDWLPTYDTGDGAQSLLDCTNVAIPPEEIGLDTVSVVGLDVAKPDEPEAIGLAGATTIAYESSSHLYLATSPATGCVGCLVGPPGRILPLAGRQGGTSHVYDFDLDGIHAVHVASGEVEGTIADRWSMDEADDVLRVAVGRSSETSDASSVVTMKRVGEELVEIDRLDGLGKHEELKGVRWFDDLAVLVTFRQVDPLFTIDLTDPAKLRVIGHLKIPGYSDYLHPLSADELLGIGYEGGDAQIGLFDVSDLAHVKRTDVEHYSNTSAVATQEPRAFTWLREHDAVLTVLQKDNTGYVDVVTVRNGRLSSELTVVEHGSADIAAVRTLGLPDGKVVLVTGEDVRYFPTP